MSKTIPKHDTSGRSGTQTGRGGTQDEITVEATLLEVYYSQPESGFIVARFEIENELFPMTAVGEMFASMPGDMYLLTGKWADHPRYGRQFRWSSYEVMYPTTTEGIERYLSSGLIKGVGKGLARRIVALFESHTIDVMNEDIDRLLEVEGIGEKKMVVIRESWEKQRGIQQVMLFLKAHDVGTSYAIRIYQAYGNEAVQRLRENPYNLVYDVDGIGYVVADRIALALGIARDDERRLVAGAVFVLKEAAARQGHSCLSYEEFREMAAAILNAHEEDVLPALRTAVEFGEIIQESDTLYLPLLYQAEHAVAACVREASAAPPRNPDHLQLEQEVRKIERQTDVEFTAQQTEAIHEAVNGPYTIITGGPGTGKTTAITGILALAEKLEWTTAVCAPTGRAAKRIAELTGAEATTIHRLLEFDPRSGQFLRNEDDPLNIDMLIVDEVSMVDIVLMAWLLRAVPPACRVVLVGDVDQLPSIAPGNVLRDMIESGVIETVVLGLVLRQSAHGSIAANAHRLRKGFMPVFDSELLVGHESFFHELKEGEDVAEVMKTYIMESLPDEFDCDPLRDIQVLSPMHKTDAGVRRLNHLLQDAFNPQGEVLFRKGDKEFRCGDKVMQTRNDYDKDVYNGDIGFVQKRDEEEGTLLIDFDGRDLQYTAEELDEVVLAYAITIHKSQGGEYDFVAFPAVMSHRIMLQRNLFYTAMTRAKRHFLVVGQRSALNLAVSNDRHVERNSTLRELLRESLR